MPVPLRATKRAAVASGVALGLGMPAVDALGQALGLSPGPQKLVVLFGLVSLFFGPVLLFVVGTSHLGTDERQSKAVYRASLRQVGLRALFWLMGCGLGFAILSVVRAIG